MRTCFCEHARAQRPRSEGWWGVADGPLSMLSRRRASVLLRSKGACWPLPSTPQRSFLFNRHAALTGVGFLISKRPAPLGGAVHAHYCVNGDLCPNRRRRWCPRGQAPRRSPIGNNTERAKRPTPLALTAGVQETKASSRRAIGSNSEEERAESGGEPDGWGKKKQGLVRPCSYGSILSGVHTGFVPHNVPP